jgi:hypothetical protein
MYVCRMTSVELMCVETYTLKSETPHIPGYFAIRCKARRKTNSCAGNGHTEEE